MQNGMIRVAAVTTAIRLNDPIANANVIADKINELAKSNVDVAVFPELCVCGYSVGDLLYTQALLDKSLEAVKCIASGTPSGIIAFVGAPLRIINGVYNCAVAVSGGKVLGVTPKTQLDRNDLMRFNSWSGDGVFVDTLNAPCGSNLIYRCDGCSELVIAPIVGNDIELDITQSASLCRAGATVIVNLSAKEEFVGSSARQDLLLASASYRQSCVYAIANCGEGETTTDVCYSGYDAIAENGEILSKTVPFENGIAVADIDVQLINSVRRKKLSSVVCSENAKAVTAISFNLVERESKLLRTVDRYPFVPSGSNKDGELERILQIQAYGLKTRMTAIGCKKAVIGVSGGLDSALALLVCNRACSSDMIAPITMPAFGTTEHTKGNAILLCEALGLNAKTIDIKNTATSHLKDIEHTDKDVAFENAQARVRTLTLFDYANTCGGLVVGTGDLSELALGWATYNGDHMSAYGVNGSVPKTLVKELIRYEAKRLGGKARKVLQSILDTDISPELLPPENGKITQKTEDILGKYDLIDFIAYYYVKYGFARERIEYLIKIAYNETPESELKKALDTFYNRFLPMQFKRSCMPDGAAISDVSFSPRTAFRIPSDAKKCE